MNVLKKEIIKLEKEIDNEIRYAERWMHERRKFFIKLAWVGGIIITLLIFSKIYLNVSGFG